MADSRADGSIADAWWRTAVVYQVYIRSFADADGDGVGDIPGIRSRLPYLRSLGVNALWITPWYPSPMADGGYDVADYVGIDPQFGTFDDAMGLVRDAHALGLRVMIDMVPNHTSAAHPWFVRALTAPRGSPDRAWYVIRDGRGSAGDEPPNDWQSLFGGPAWSPMPDDGRLPAQWYLHLFDSSQPDLAWDNPEVRSAFEEIIATWLDRGIDGIRIDVANFLAKDPALPDLSARVVWPPGAHPYADRDEVHEIYRAWRRVADAHGGAVFCGEINLPADRIALCLRPDELHTAFNFDLVNRPWAAGPLRRSIDRTLNSHRAAGAPATWVLGNHDLPRPSFRLGRDEQGEELNPWTRAVPSDQSLGLRRARAAALLLFALPGVAYVYQGDELGLPEVLDLPDSARRDPTFQRTGGVDIGRDGTRVPMPWAGDAPPFGFGPSGSTPWLPQPAAWGGLTVEAEDAETGSTLSMYRAALALRRRDPGLAGASFRWIDSADDVLHFGREGAFRCLVNLGAASCPLPEGAEILLRSDGVSAVAPVAPDIGVWYRIR